MVLRYFLLAAFASLPTWTVASDVDGIEVKNWVGPLVGEVEDHACYRKSHLMNKCPRGYVSDNVATCWAECPIEYPVSCAAECIPQNEDCTLEIIGKVTSVAEVAINAATSGVFGSLANAAGELPRGLRCAQSLFGVVQDVVGYAKELHNNFPNSTADEVVSLMEHSQIATVDLPTAVATCLGIPVPKELDVVSDVSDMVTAVVKQAVDKGDKLLSFDGFIDFITNINFDTGVKDMSSDDKKSLSETIDMGGTCGIKLYKSLNKVVEFVKKIKEKDPSTRTEQIHAMLTESPLILTEIPKITSYCVMNSTDDGGYSQRTDIRKTIQTVIDKVVDTSGELDLSEGIGSYVRRISELGLTVIAAFDPIGIANMAKEFIQPICGPTLLIGQIDDGPLDPALGLTTMGEAFTGSSGEWKYSGDGVAKITFVSTDTEDVTVNIQSAGTQIDQVDVKSGETVVWEKSIADLQDKTLYLDRWRPGLFGLGGTGGGSLVMWIPQTDKGGHISLTANLNVS